MWEGAGPVFRELWKGGSQAPLVLFNPAERARIYTRPEVLPPIYVAASGTKAAGLAGRIGDGLIMSERDPDVVRAFDGTGGRGKPRYVEMSGCWAENEREAGETAAEGGAS